MPESRFFAHMLALVACACVPICTGAAVVPVDTEANTEAVGYEAFRALDGNPVTMWHSNWHGNYVKQPHDLVIDMGKPFNVEGIGYLPRRDGNNGTITKYELYAGNNLENLGKPVARGTFAERNRENVIPLKLPGEVRYMRLRAFRACGALPKVPARSRDAATMPFTWWMYSAIRCSSIVTRQLPV